MTSLGHNELRCVLHGTHVPYSTQSYLPCVVFRVHVRRTDKVGTEAAFHSIDEYMWYVEDYYKLLEKRQQIDKRRVYLATDDPNLLGEAKSK